MTVIDFDDAGPAGDLAIIQRWQWDTIKQALPNVVLTVGCGTPEAGSAMCGPHPKGIRTPLLAPGCSLA
jgi:hypothetical protein